MAFTTEKHKTFSRKCGVVRRRAIEYLSELDVKECPLDCAIEKFSEITGLYDRKTKDAYFGTKEHRSKRSMWRRASYPGSGTVSNKSIELTQTVPTTKGYLEKLGLVRFEQRGKKKIWFMIVNTNTVLFPQLYERCHVSKQNISLPPIRQNGVGKDHGKTEVVSLYNLENNNNLQGEREKNTPKISPKILQLTPLEVAILRAEPCKEPDNSKTNSKKQAAIDQPSDGGYY